MKTLVLVGILSFYFLCGVESLTHLHHSIDCVDGETAVTEVVFCKKNPCDPLLKCVSKSEHLCSQYKPCLNHGVCQPQDDGDFKCTCRTGTIGRYCEDFLLS
ncbi:hypothetical protein SNE40_000888 [Patella caerulea]|uniref:EGF-like domain-containing protein n=1 Tax=Patella caerulea TaxID=87958 RepID=A0AAN8QAJ3_PATCE